METWGINLMPRDEFIAERCMSGLFDGPAYCFAMVRFGDLAAVRYEAYDSFFAKCR